MISILILTKNEEKDLPGCLDSVAWSDDIHVFDSMSTDRTAEIACSRGAHFTQRPFDTYAAQRNAALETLPFRHEWIFLPDADERPTPALIEEMKRAAASAPAEVAGFRVRRRDFMGGTWLKHAQLSPYFIRLVRNRRASYVREVNEILEVDGGVGELHSYLDHFPFSKGLTWWISRHNVYSTMEAQIVASRAGQDRASLRTALFEKDFHVRRASQKALFYRLPGRPLIKWLYMMFARGAIFDGPAGWTYAVLQTIYEYFIVLKTREILSKEPAQG
jgi:glycosyltransferase involved in cell wall biosynthesis